MTKGLFDICNNLGNFGDLSRDITGTIQKLFTTNEHEGTRRGKGLDANYHELLEPNCLFAELGGESGHLLQFNVDAA